MNFIDSFLNKITMYRLVLYYLTILLVAAVLFSAFGILAFSPLYLLFSIAFITLVSWVANELFAYVYKVPANIESVYITAFILALIISPAQSIFDASFLQIAGWASLLAIASKYILAIRKKHIFNPAALGVAVTGLALGLHASWWVGTMSMMPFVLVGGLLVVRKVLRSDLVFSFLALALLTFFILHFTTLSAIPHLFWRLLVDTPILFFAFVMLTEPLTTPPTELRRMWYGAFVGLLYAPGFHIGSVSTTPELALLVGNILSYLLSPKMRLVLTLKEKKQLTPDTYDFVFTPDQKMSFRPGQYLEWTLGHKKTDARGNRRYFTIASSPTEEVIRMGVKFYPNSSTFKTALGSLVPGDHIVASQLAGDFTLPKDVSKKLVFIAGGIGVTPFRSMAQYMLDKKDVRDAVLLYSARTDKDLAYKEIFDEAREKVGLKTVYAVGSGAEGNTEVQIRMIDKEMIQREVPDFHDRQFYISGPHGMVAAFEHTLRDMGVKKGNIIVDFFPGFV